MAEQQSRTPQISIHRFNGITYSALVLERDRFHSNRDGDVYTDTIYADASDLDFSSGYWPQAIEVDGLVYILQCREADPDGDTVAMHYSTFARTGHAVLWND